MSEAAQPMTQIHQVDNRRQGTFDRLIRLLRCWQATLQFEGLKELEQNLRDASKGTLVLFWHNRLFPVLGAFQRFGNPPVRMGALVSASRDGAQMAYFVGRLGVRPIRGSSSRRGAVATRELLRLHEEGYHVAIAVDGPRGPCYRAQPGAALLAHKTGVEVFCLGMEMESAYELRSWDRFILPAPFSRVKIKLDRLTGPFPGEGKDKREAIQAIIQNRLTALTGDLHRRA